MHYAVSEVGENASEKNGLENLVLITQFGLNVVTPVLICVLLGSWIDKRPDFLPF